MIIFAVYNTHEDSNLQVVDYSNCFLQALLNFCEDKEVEIEIDDNVDKQENIDLILDILRNCEYVISNYIKFDNVLFNTISIENNNLELIIKKKDS